MPHKNTGHSGSSNLSLPEYLHNRKVIKSFKHIDNPRLRLLRQKLVAQKVTQVWYVRIQISRKHRLAWFLESTIKSMEKTYKEWRLIDAN